MSDLHATLRRNLGKPPAEMIQALYDAGFAIVPVQPIPGCEGVTILRSHKPFADRYEAVVEHARAK